MMHGQQNIKCVLHVGDACFWNTKQGILNTALLKQEKLLTYAGKENQIHNVALWVTKGCTEYVGSNGTAYHLNRGSVLFDSWTTY
jgi:hypothetical protein